MKAVYIDMIVIVCVIQILTGSSYGINNLSNQYQWVHYKHELFNDTRLFVLEKFQNYTYAVARLIYKYDDKIPCGMAILYDSKEIYPITAVNEEDVDIEVLLIESGHRQWIKSSNGTVENNAIEGGNIKNETVYVCGIQHYDTYYVGRMQPSKHSCFLEDDTKHHSDYWLLTYLK